MSAVSEVEPNNETFWIAIYSRQTDSHLTLYRILRASGYPIDIQDEYDEDGYIATSAVRIPKSISEKIDNIYWNIVHNTRKGNAVFGADVGAPHDLLKQIDTNQASSSSFSEAFNKSSLVPIDALRSCFVSGYEKVDGYRWNPGRSNGEGLDSAYQEFIGMNVRPIDPEGMAILQTEALQELQVID